MGLFDDLYGPYNKVVSQPVLPTTPLPAVPATQPGATTTAPDPFHALLMSLLTPKSTTQTNGFDFNGLIKALRNDPTGDANRLSSLPSYVPGSQSPFNTGFFNRRY